MRLLVALLLLGALAGCGKDTVEYASVPTEKTTTTIAGRLGCDFFIAGAQLHPAPAVAAPLWTPDQARAAIATANYFKQLAEAGKPFDLWLATFSGAIPNPATFENHLTTSTVLSDQLVWLVVVDDLMLQPSSRERNIDGVAKDTDRGPVPGYAAAAFIDGVSPVQSVSGFQQGGGTPPSTC